MATREDISVACGVVRDSLVVMRWAASEGRTAEGADLVPSALRPSLVEAVDEVHDGPFRQAMRIFDYEDEEYPYQRVSDILDSVGWYGAQRVFKEQALDLAGRPEVVLAAQGGPRPRGRVWRRFIRVLDAGLESLSAIPGVEPILELKGFVEAAQDE